MKVALYARVSTKDQTTDNQTIRLRSYAKTRVYEVVDEYVDVASGKNAHRPELDRMLADAKQHRFEKIIAVKIDRVGRSLINLKNIVDNLEKWNVGLEMIDQDIDTRSASGRLMINLLGAFAEFERELIVERTRDGLARAKKQGKKLGNECKTLTPYQIDKAKRILAENPNISQRKLAEQFEGISRTCLISGLRDLGLISGRQTGCNGVYKEPNEKSSGRQANVRKPQTDPIYIRSRVANEGME